MELDNLLYLASLTTEEYEEVKEYLHEVGKMEMMQYVAYNLYILSNYERYYFSCIPSGYGELSEEQLDCELDKLNKLLDLSILNARQVYLTDYYEYIVENMCNLKSLDIRPVPEMATQEEGNRFQEEIYAYNEATVSAVDGYEQFIKEYNAEKQHMSVFQLNVQYIIDGQYYLYKEIIKQHETHLQEDIGKNEYVMLESQRLRTYMQDLQRKNFLLTYLIQKESFARCNKLEITYDGEDDGNLYNAMEILRRLQEENIQLNAEYMDIVQDVVDPTIFRQQSQILRYLSSDYDYHIQQFRIIYDFIKGGYNEIDLVINSSNNVVDITVEVLDRSKEFLNATKKQHGIVQEVVMQVMRNSERINEIKKLPLLYLRVDAIIEYLVNRKIETVADAHDQYYAALQEYVVDQNQYESDNIVKREMFRKYYILRNLKVVYEESARLYNRLADMEQVVAQSSTVERAY